MTFKVYDIFLRQSGSVIYVGVTRNLQQRIGSHRLQSPIGRFHHLLGLIDFRIAHETDSESEALQIEWERIQTLRAKGEATANRQNRVMKHC